MNAESSMSIEREIDPVTDAGQSWARCLTIHHGKIAGGLDGISPGTVDRTIEAAIRRYRFVLVIQNGKARASSQEAFGLGPAGLQRLDQEQHQTPFKMTDILSAFRRSGTLRADAPSRAALRQFAASLDCRLLTALRRCNLLQSTAYNWCQIDKERRPAALLSNCILAGGMVRNSNIEAVIANSGSLIDILATEYNLSRGFVRHLGHLPVFSHPDRKKGLLLALDKLPADLWPRTKLGFLIANDLLALENRILMDGAGNKNAATIQTLRSPLLPKVRDLFDLPQISRHKSVDPAFDLIDGAAVTQHYFLALEGLISNLLIPACLDAGISLNKTSLQTLVEKRGSSGLKQQIDHQLTQMLIGNAGLANIARICAARQVRYLVPAPSSDSILSKAGFPHLVKYPIVIGKVLFTPILTFKMLQEHHRLMASYNHHSIEFAGGRRFEFAGELPNGTLFTAVIEYTDSRLTTPKFETSGHSAADSANRLAMANSIKLLLLCLRRMKMQPAGGEAALDMALEHNCYQIYKDRPEIIRDVARRNYLKWRFILPTRLRGRSYEDFRGGQLVQIFADNVKTKLQKASKSKKP